MIDNATNNDTFCEKLSIILKNITPSLGIQQCIVFAVVLTSYNFLCRLS